MVIYIDYVLYVSIFKHTRKEEKEKKINLFNT